MSRQTEIGLTPYHAHSWSTDNTSKGKPAPGMGRFYMREDVEAAWAVRDHREAAQAEQHAFELRRKDADIAFLLKELGR